MRFAIPLTVAVALALPSSAAAADCTLDPSTPAQAQPATGLNEMFAAYGDSNRRLDDWTGADNTASVQLPDGRTAWVFADTFLDRVNADHSRDEDDFIQNSIVLQRGNHLVDTLHGGTRRHPETLVQTDDGHQSDGKEEVGDSWYWANGATVDGGKLHVFVNKYWMYSEEVFGFEWLGNAIATFSLPGLKLENVRQIVSADGVTWGSTVYREGGYSYVYGNRSQRADARARQAGRPARPLGVLDGQRLVDPLPRLGPAVPGDRHRGRHPDASATPTCSSRSTTAASCPPTSSRTALAA